MKKFIITLKNFALIIIATFFILLLLEIFSRNFIKKIPTKIFHFDKNALIWNQEIGSHAFKKPSKSLMTNGHFKEYIFIDKNGFRINSPEENIINPKTTKVLLNFPYIQAVIVIKTRRLIIKPSDTVTAIPKILIIKRVIENNLYLS